MIHAQLPSTYLACLIVTSVVLFASSFSSLAMADGFPAVFLPQAAPAPSSVAVSITAPIVGSATDSSSLSGDATLVVGQTNEPFNFAQLVDMNLILDDGMDFSLLGGAVTARAEPGATRVRMIESGPAGAVTNGIFDQLENIFQFEGEIFLSTEDAPYDLSTVAPMQADLLGIQIENRGNQMVATLSVDLEFTAAVAVPLLGQIPLSIQILGNLEAVASLTGLGDFDNNGLLDANDIDLLHAAIREQNADPAFDLNGDGQLTSADSGVMIHDFMQTYYGDANLDRIFDSSDLIVAMQFGQYEDGVQGNSGWTEGDWSGDGDFMSDDLVLALSDGCFESCVGSPAVAASVPEPPSLLLLAVPAAVCLVLRHRSPRMLAR